MSIGPYIIRNNSVAYRGNKRFSPARKLNEKPPRKITRRHLDVARQQDHWAALMRIWDGVFRASQVFMTQKGALLFDLPITTRMISSPGALTGTIITDINPLRLNFFGNKVFLTQSSQLYLEFAITNPSVHSVYCWEKSFRREHADFRHLPEFTHIEYESNVNFQTILSVQQKFIQFLIAWLLKNNDADMKVFLTSVDIRDLRKLTSLRKFPTITFRQAFEILWKKTGKKVYRDPSVRFFQVFEEVMITEKFGCPVYVTNYPEGEVAFYHAADPRKPGTVINADLLFPGYGELIGCGERVHSAAETRAKARRFRLDQKDYQPYIDSRKLPSVKIHSGWGMGIERFIQAVLKLPDIWEAKVFPRVDTTIRP